ncbi:hypothetical protein [Fusobacterium sp.]|uniref:hypothetical protein n=2 Tax=Fusobacterium TaxID=848 RepID=UPI0025C6BC36|nr:hypothetical protein [Fusobacterium sp.]MCI5725277.1 hypothetical protein [Fusobacterium sp.]
MKMRKMTTINKKYIIKSEDQYGEKTFEIVKGFHEVRSLGAYRRYFYLSKHGECEIILTNNSITIIRKGTFNNTFEILFTGEKNKFLYETDLIKEIFYSYGENINYDIKNKIFSFSYKLFDTNNNEINRITFSIKEI